MTTKGPESPEEAALVERARPGIAGTVREHVCNGGISNRDRGIARATYRNIGARSAGQVDRIVGDSLWRRRPPDAMARQQFHFALAVHRYIARPGIGIGDQ
jgi:hypothetical protein